MKAPLCSFLACLAASVQPAFAQQQPYRLSGPYTHDNATLFLVHRAASSAAPAAGRKYLPLKEALARRKVLVHETGNVNQLSIENVSADADVFIQSGDIVKGGQQDRVFSTDLILPPKSGRTPIEAFCVEQGRWSKRGAEDARQFSASANAIVSRDAKLAIKRSKNQGEVWQSVAKVQEKLARSFRMSAPVASAASPTSLQLSLENRKVAETADQFGAALRKAAGGQTSTAIGYVLAVNGEIQGADIYAWPELFRDLWPKQSQALAIEALSEKTTAGGGKPKAVTSAAASGFLAAAERTPGPVPEAPNRRTRVVKKDSARALLVESHDVTARSWVHRNYTAK